MSTGLKALKNCEMIGGVGPLDLIYACLVRYYARLGNSQAAEEYYWKLINSPPKARPVDNNLTNEFYVLRAQAAFSVLKNCWDDAKQSFEKAFELSRKITMYLTMFLRNDYAWTLTKQGRIEEAKAQIEESQKVYSEIEENFSHVNIQASLMAPWKILVGEEFEIRLDLVNVSKQPGKLVKVEFIIPLGFRATTQPAYYSLENDCIDMKRRNINPFQVDTVKLKLKASKAGTYEMHPKVVYIDESGQTKICEAEQVNTTVQAAKRQFEVLPGRVSTGFEDLDTLLFGGIPEKYAVALASPSSDERELLVKKFLEAGVESGEATFFVTCEPSNARALADEHPSHFFLFVCNPQTDTMVQSKSNIFKLNGLDSLTDIDIALTRAFRNLNSSVVGPRRVSIDILSDVLLQHHAVNTRRWLSALLPMLKSKGFAILAVMDPQMHPPEEVQAILGLFDGEIRITERETAEGTEKFLKIKKLYNQKYLEKEVLLSKEKLEQ